jgi:sulfur relay protein TusB/DsrH
MSDKKALFVVSQPPTKCDLGRHLAVAQRAAGAAALLIGDGVYFVNTDGLAPLFEAGLPVFALRDSVEARGLVDRVPGNVELVDYHRVVDLMMEEYDDIM